MDVKYGHGWTALILAAREGHEETVRTLLQYGADPHIKENFGRTAMDDAKTDRIREILREHAGPAEA